MQSRAVREGSVGLMLLAGVGIFVAASMWLKGLGPGSQKYNILASFADAGGIQQGGPVRYRGVRVGKIASIKPGANAMEVVLEITDPDLKIPSNAIAEANQTGLIGEPVVEITPRGQVSLAQNLAPALDKNCNAQVIICNNGQIPGTVGSSFNELLKRATALVNRYESPEITNGIKLTLKNASQAAADISLLSKKFGDLPDSLKKELGTISVSANTLTKSLNGTVKNVDVAVGKIGNTADKFNITATKVNKTADNLTVTVGEYGKLAKSVDALVTENRQTFGKTLTNFNTLSVDLSQTVRKLNPTIDKLNSTVAKVNSESLVKDLEGVLSNANKTAANLRDISASFNNPKSLVNLQQTLDSARLTFQNTQKITADLDRLTGDPEFISSVSKLVKGLGQLVSTGETLEQQIQLGQELEPMHRNMSVTTANLVNSDPELAAAIGIVNSPSNSIVSPPQRLSDLLQK
jgi:phospholipid/cholesterol/gamma-HCH transport system substrate-binding protein